MRKVIADLRQCPDREALHDVLSEAFAFPDYYGRNLDALYDLLTEMSEDTCAAVLFPPEAANAHAADTHASFSHDPGDDTRAMIDRDEDPHALIAQDDDPGFSHYLALLRSTLADAEFENPHLWILMI